MGLEQPKDPENDPQELRERIAELEKRSGDAGAPDFDSSRDAGLQRCENPHGDATGVQEGAGSG